MSSQGLKAWFEGIRTLSSTYSETALPLKVEMTFGLRYRILAQRRNAARNKKRLPPEFCSWKRGLELQGAIF